MFSFCRWSVLPFLEGQGNKLSCFSSSFDCCVVNRLKIRWRMEKYNTEQPSSLRSSGDPVLHFSMLLVRIPTSVQEGFVFCQAFRRRMHGDARRSHGAEVVRIESGLRVGFLQVAKGQSCRGAKNSQGYQQFQLLFCAPCRPITV